MYDPYVSKARGRDPYTLYCYNIHCLDISHVPTEFYVPACVKSQNNTQKSTAPTKSRINVHEQTHEHVVCKNAYNNNYLIRLEDRQLFVKANTCLLQQTACLVVNPITVGNFSFLFNCTPVGRTSDSMMVPT